MTLDERCESEQNWDKEENKEGKSDKQTKDGVELPGKDNDGERRMLNENLF